MTTKPSPDRVLSSHAKQLSKFHRQDTLKQSLELSPHKKSTVEQKQMRMSQTGALDTKTQGGNKVNSDMQDLQLMKLLDSISNDHTRQKFVLMKDESRVEKIRNAQATSFLQTPPTQQSLEPVQLPQVFEPTFEEIPKSPFKDSKNKTQWKDIS